MRHSRPNPAKTTNWSPRRSNKTTHANKPRRASTYSVSTVSSISDVDELSDLVDDSDDDADDEEDQQVVPVPSHGRRRSKSQKKGIRYSRQMANGADFGHYDSDSDDAYAAVDDITDGDDEDQNVEKLEELLILESEDDHLDSVLNTPSITGSGDLAGPGLFDNDLLIPNANFFDEEQLYAAMETFGESDATSDAAVETPVPRRVHFQESDSSSDSDSLTDDEIPGDFLQQDSLDPQLRRMIESDNENQTRHGRRSDDVFGESDYGHANIYHAESDADSHGSSGYESMQTCRYLCSPSFVLTPMKPMMAKLQMKTCLLPQPLRTPGPSSAATRPPRWLPQMMKASARLLVGEGRSLAHLSQIRTSRLLWWTAPVNTW